jgi:hypothetical protein
MLALFCRQQENLTFDFVRGMSAWQLVSFAFSGRILSYHWLCGKVSQKCPLVRAQGK